MKIKLLITFLGLSIGSLYAQYNGLFQSNNLTYLPDGTGVQYQDSFVVTGLPSSATFLDPIFLNSVCVEMEHSYLGDLEMWVECPNGQTAVLINSFGAGGAIPGGNSGGGTYLGHPYDDAGGGGAGTPFTYCFSTNYNALSSISNNLGNTIQVTALNTNPPLSAGNSLNPAQIYAPETSFSSLKRTFFLISICTFDISGVNCWAGDGGSCWTTCCDPGKSSIFVDIDIFNFFINYL